MSRKDRDERAVAPAEARWDQVILVCSKCARKQGEDELRHDLKKALKRRGLGRDVRVVESGCLDLCPKHGVSVLTAPAGRLGILAPGGDADAALAWLLPETARQPA